jgi:hypothetical protein
MGVDRNRKRVKKNRREQKRVEVSRRGAEESKERVKRS